MTQAMDTPIVDAACRYAARGWRILPVASATKRPILKDWPNQATDDPMQIKTWWAQSYRNSIIGITCGAASGILCIDIDPRHNGEMGLAELEHRHGPLPETLMSRTGSGGKHLIFRYPADQHVPNAAKLDGCDGVDVRGQGGMFVAPPSVSSSGQYAWLNDGAEPQPLPAAWIALLVKQKPLTADSNTDLGGVKIPLTNPCNRFLIEGVGEGVRAVTLFKCAAEMAGNGWSIQEATPLLLQACDRCRPSYPHDEALPQIKSAFARPRTPNTSDTESSASASAAGDVAQLRVPSGSPNADSSGRADVPVASSAVEVKKLSQFTQIANVFFSKGQEEETHTNVKPIAQIAAEIREATGGPWRVAGSIFTLGTIPATGIPGRDALRFLDKQESLFAWLHERTSVLWLTGGRAKSRNHATGDPATVVSRQELYEHLKEAARPNYAAVEVMPHWPRVDGILYIEFGMPTATGDALDELAGRFNADSEEDRALLVAALLTPGWGGPCGSRPGFIFTSQYGRGTGKTTTAEAFCEVWGGRISISPDVDDWEKVKSRLLCEDSLAKRCGLIDNIRTKLSGSDLEGLLTGPVIDGWRPYAGQFQRPNRLTFYLTANTPKMSQDLADRCVIVQIGTQRHEQQFREWFEPWLTANRLQLLSDLIAELRHEPRCEITRENRDRWGMWQTAVLSRFENGNELAAMIKARRPAVDSDAEDADEIAEAITLELTARGHQPYEVVRISRQDMAEILRDRQLIDKHMTRRGVTTWLKNLSGHKSLGRLQDNPSRKSLGRSWLWHSDTAIPDTVPSDLRQKGGLR